MALVLVFTFLADRSFAQPANDNPCGAVVLASPTSCSNTSGTNVSATSTPTGGLPAPGCAGYSGGDVWYQATVNGSGQVTVTTSTNGGFNDTGLAFYTAASCAGPFSLVGCDNNSGSGSMSQLSYTGAPGTVLWIRVWENGNNSFGTFNICATAPAPPPPPPANNDPCGAIATTVGAGCSFATYTNVNATNTSGYTAPGCGSFGGTSLDVWFTFVAPATGTMTIETQAGGLTNAAMALYYDAPPLDCAGPFTLVQCDDDSGPGLMPLQSFNNLVPGGTYYLRAWGPSAASGTFGLCMHGPDSVPVSGCAYMLELFDSFGNGWGSSAVGVSINGGPFVNYSITGSYGLWLIGLNAGDVLVLQYDASGPNQAQNSYELGYFPSGATIFTAGPTPAAGIAFAQSVTCQPPPALPNDCIGGTTVCGGQAFNNNSNGTGNQVDLNAANQGCLASGERQGTWYIFSPSSAGNVGFTIAPSVPTDYDFAVWGPYPPGSTTTSICAPSAPPLRCSYSALQVNTGCGNGAADVTEGAGGNAWVSTINVSVGQVYLLYIDNFSTNGQAFSLTWQLGGGASLDCSLLPVELLSFTGEAKDDGVELQWATASEMNSDHFEIERSPTGDAFSPIGSVAGAGTVQHRSDYSFVDRYPLTGMNYYRLKQVDIDGESKHSNTIAIRRAIYGEALNVFPSPSQGAITVTVEEGSLATEIRMFDATGRDIVRYDVNGTLTSIDAHVLPNGTYFVRLLGPAGEVLAVVPWVKR